MNRDALDHAVRYIKSWLADRFEQENVPGFVAAVSYNGEILMNEAYGYADLDRQIPMTPGHVFRVASHSKTFTATSIMQLAEEGRLRIDDCVAEYIPWLKQHEDKRWAHVTLRQLLSHGAGVIRDGLDKDYWALARPFPDEDRFVREMKETGLILDNNTKMKYTNYGYTLLGMVIEAVSGQPYNDYVLDHVVRPLGLTHTFPEYRPELEQPRAEELVTGYARRDPDNRLPIDHMSTEAMSPATGFCSTSEELCAYFTAQMVGSGKLLRDESKKEMQKAAWPHLTPGQPRNQEYGLGFQLQRYGERQTFGHSGGFPGHITNTKADPKEGLVVTALTNSVDGPAAGIVSGIYRILSYFEEHTPMRAGAVVTGAGTGVAKGPDEGAHDWSALEGTYASLWGQLNVVALGDELVTVSGNGWDPVAMVEKLEWVEGQTFKIVETASGASEGELVHFHTDDDGHVEYVVYAGGKTWPKAVWREKIAGLDRVSVGTE